MTKPHGMTGKQNAMIGERPHSELLSCRVYPDTKIALEKSAAGLGIKRSRLISQILERWARSGSSVDAN